MLEGDLSFHADIYYPSRRQDLDPSILLDALQGLVAVDADLEDLMIARLTAMAAINKAGGVK